jgi:hypothetical protein
MVTFVLVATLLVTMLKAGETELPPGTVTEEGMDATAGFELVRLTVIPVPGAAYARLTVFPFVAWPPLDNLGTKRYRRYRYAQRNGIQHQVLVVNRDKVVVQQGGVARGHRDAFVGAAQAALGEVEELGYGASRIPGNGRQHDARSCYVEPVTGGWALEDP